jgi:hypothetical protein
MKKIPEKLVLRRETLRTLVNMDLARAVGGSDCNDVQRLAVIDSGDKACSTDAVIIATAACR